MKLRSIGLVLLGMVFGVVLTAGLGKWLFLHNMEKTFRPPKFPTAVTIKDSWRVLSLDGKSIELVPGKKVLFICYWATWCAPCHLEMPTIDRLYAHMKDRDIVFACISDEEPEVVKEFVAKKKWSVPIYIKGKSELPLSPEGYPTTIIIDRQGTVVFRESEAANWDSQESLLFLNKLLAMPKGSE